MNTFKNFEREFVIGDTHVFNQFNNSQFISNAKTVLEGAPQPVDISVNNFGYYTSMIEKSIQNFSVITLDKELIQEFLSKFETISKLDSSDIMVRDITYSDVGPFKPQYLTQYTSMVQIAIDKAIKGEITESEIIRYVSGEIPEKIERQVVKSPLTAGVRPKDLVIVDDTKKVKADTTFVKTKVIPFVSRYDVIKNEMLVEANSVLNAIKETEETLKAMCDTVNKIKMTNNLDMRRLQLLNQISYNAFKGIMEVISYISYMLIRKINSVSSNIMACNQLYIDISNIYGGATTLESAFDQNLFPTDVMSLGENLIQGRSDAFDTLAEHIYNFYTSLPDPDRVDYSLNTGAVNNELDQQEYDNTVYENICKAYLEISVGLDVMSKEGDQFLMVYDDIIKQSGFGIILEERFQNEINALKVVSDGYTDIRRLLAEVKDFPNNMRKLAKIIAEVYEKITYLAKRFADNNNGEYTDTETVNELKIFLGELENQYKEMTAKVADSCYDRIKNLGIRISSIKEINEPKKEINTVDIETSSDLDMTESFDFEELAYEMELEMIEESNKEYFDTLQCAYFAERAKLTRGTNVVFEDGENTTTPTTTTTNNNANAQNKPKANTKVSVTDNSGNAKSGASKVFAKIAEFFRNVIDRFMEVIGKSATKNQKWLADNKDALLNRSYNNVTLNILPYSNIAYNAAITDLSKIKTFVSNTDNIKQSINSSNTKEELWAKLFPFCTGGLKEANGSLGDQVRKYYMVGSTTAELNVQAVSNGNLKALVTNEMIPYCEAYLGQFKDQIKNSTDEVVKYIKLLAKAAEVAGEAKSMGVEVVNNGPAKTTTESVLYMEEGEGTNNGTNTNSTAPTVTSNNNTGGTQTNTNTTTTTNNTANNNANNNNKTDNTKNAWFASAINTYLGAVLNAARVRNSDYLKALNSLVPKNGTAKQATPETPAENNTENNAGEGEADNNNNNNNG